MRYKILCKRSLAENTKFEQKKKNTKVKFNNKYKSNFSDGDIFVAL